MPKRHKTSLPSEIVMMDGVTLANAIHSQQVSCAGVMIAYLDHIEMINPHVNAIVALRDRASLLDQSKEYDARLARGESVGRLHGVPHAVKDLRPVKGMRMTMGSPILKDFVPTADSVGRAAAPGRRNHHRENKYR